MISAWRLRRVLHGLLVVCIWLAGSTDRLQLRADEPAAAKEAVEKAAAALYSGIRVETLPNGLHVYLKPIPRSPVVTTMVAYKVGSADEEMNSTGLSHYLEHLMFKGTDKIKPGDIDRLTLRNGGANNAFTAEDYTIYYFDFAADRWDAALEIEADRMQHLRIDSQHEFEQEKGAVIEELERNEDTPWDLEGKLILPILFGTTGPYGHPVIGERQHVRGASSAVIKAHYDRWYHPNNASLVVCGGFDPDKAMERIKQLFGPIPQEPLPARKTVPEVKRSGPIHKEMTSKFEVPRMLVGFNTVRTGDPDYYALEVVQAVLSSGKTSRLYKDLVEGKEIASEVGCSNNTGRFPGAFSIQVELLKGKDLHEAEGLVLDEVKRLRDEPVSEVELKRVQRQLVAGAVFDRESVHSLADSIARGVTTNDLEFLKTYLPRVAAVTAQDVQAVARKYLQPEQRVVVWSVPQKEGAGARNPTSKATRQLYAGNPLLHGPLACRLLARPQDAGETSYSLQEAHRVVLPNGLILLLYENHRLPIVVAEAFVDKTRLLETDDKSGIVALTGRLLDEGTPHHTGPQISELIENVGGALGLSGSGGSVKVLTPDRALGLGLLLECLSQASFPKEPFARERQRQLSEIADELRRPDQVAQLLFRKLVYGEHPYSRPSLGQRETVEKLTPADCIAFHQRLFVPDNTRLAIVGDFDSQQVIAEVTRLTTEWKPSPVTRPQTPAVHPPGEFLERIVSMPDAAQLHFYMGQIGIRRNDPDYYRLVVMDYVLGTGPGFTDRLSSRLRDRQGLAYTVSANISSSAGEEPGLFACYIGTRPENFSLVKKLFLEELNRIRDETPRPEEVEDAKKYLLGSLPFQLTTNDRIAGQLLYIERFHLGLDYLDQYRKAIAAVTPEDVHAVARKHIDPAHLVLVAAGAISQQGKPLHASPGDKPAEPNK